LSSLGTSRFITLDSAWLTHVLLVATTVRVVYGVHRYASRLGPLIALCLVLVVGASCLEHGLICSATTCNKANHGSARVGDGLLAARGQADTRDALVGIV